MGSPEHVKLVGLRKGLLSWKPQATVGKDEPNHFLLWDQDLDQGMGPCDEGWEKCMWSLCRTRIQGDNLGLCYRAFQQTYPRRVLGGWFGAWAYCCWPGGLG